MKNSEQPISPCMMQKVGDNDYRASKPNDPKEWNIPCKGLSKREYAAIMAMQGILANYSGIILLPSPNSIAAKSAQYADALLSELEKQKA